MLQERKTNLNRRHNYDLNDLVVYKIVKPLKQNKLELPSSTKTPTFVSVSKHHQTLKTLLYIFCRTLFKRKQTRAQRVLDAV